MNALLPFAQEMLSKYGEFFPFGGYVDEGGGISHVNGWTGEEQPPSQEIINLINAGLRERAKRGEIRASGLCIDVLTIPPRETQKRDAISVRLEHANGESVVVFLPYRRSATGEYEYDEVYAMHGTQEVFGLQKGL